MTHEYASCPDYAFCQFCAEYDNGYQQGKAKLHFEVLNGVGGLAQSILTELTTKYARQASTVAARLALGADGCCAPDCEWRDVGCGNADCYPDVSDVVEGATATPAFRYRLSIGEYAAAIAVAVETAYRESMD